MKNGQSLVELLLAIAILSIILPGILVGFFATRGGRATQEQRQHATAYLNEAEEALRVIKSNGWTNLASGVYHPVVSGNSWSLLSGDEVIGGNYTRKITISDIYRDSNGNIVTEGGTVDPSIKLAEISVSWTTPLPLSVTSKTYLTRHSNKVYTETTEANFNAGIVNQIQVTNTSGGEIRLANNNKGKWCSPSFSSSTIDLPDGPPVAVVATASATSINTPNDVFVAVAPDTSTSTKLAYVTVTANADPPSTTLQGTFTLDPTKYSSGTFPTTLGNPPTIPNLDNSFRTNDITYYKSSSGNLYALLATNLPDKEVVVVQIKDSLGNAYQDSVNKIYKYWTFFNTKMSSYVATDTGFRNPSANSAETSSAGDNNGFQSNATRAYSDNNSFAVDTDSGNNTGTSCTGNDKDKHRYYNYGFSLPSGATIDGIEVRLDARVDSTTGNPKMCVQLSWDGGLSWTAAQSTNNLTTSEASYILGSPTDTWGRTWSDANLSNSNFRLRVINVVSNTSRDFSLDWAAVKIYYNNSTTNDYAPHDYGATTIATLGSRGYVASGGYLYTFDLSNIDSKSPTSGLDMIGCRIELDGYDCRPGSPAVDKKYDPGETGGVWSDIGSPVHNDCSDGGNIELNATNDIYPLSIDGNNYIFAAVGAGTNPEFDIVNATNVPNSSTSPALSSNSCGRISGGNSGWRRVGSYDFNSDSGTEEAANSVFAKNDGTRAYITSNGGVDSKQYYIINTTNKSSPVFLSGSPSTGPSSGYYNASGANGELYPRRAVTVQNGLRAILVGKDGISNSSDAQEYQVLDSTTETTPSYCGGLNYDIGFNDLTAVSELDGDNYVYMVANTSSNELKIIQGGPDNAIYVPTGSFESQIFNATGEAMFNRFFANATVPADTTLTYQVALTKAVSDSCSAPTYSYVGPDGTSSTYFTAGSPLPISIAPNGYQNPAQCLRYKVFMTSSNQLQTPVLSDINFNYSP